MSLSLETLGAARKYTDGSIEGIVGTLAGKPAQVQSISPIDGGNRVTFLWEDNSGDSHTSTMDVMNGQDGQDGDVPAETLLKDTVGWTGKNLCPHATWFDRTHGVTFTMDNDGVITANGTATDQNVMAKAFFTPLFSGQIILNGCNSGDPKVHLYPYDQTNSLRPYKDSSKTERWDVNDNVYNGNEISFYVEAGVEYSINCRVIKNNTANNVKFYPMLRKAEISDPTFEPYHEDVVDTLRDAEVITGKNIIPVPYYSAFDGNNAGTIEPTVNSDGSITFSAGTSSSSGAKYYYLISRFDSHFTVPAGRYWCSGIPSDAPEGITLVFGCTRNGEGYTYNTLSAGDVKVGNVKTGDELGLTIKIDTSTTISSPITFYPMICTEADWNKSHDYKPYYTPVKDAMFPRDEQAVMGSVNDFEVSLAKLKSLNTSGTWSSNTYTLNNVVFTVNSDGTISATGQASSLTYLDLDANFDTTKFAGWYLSGLPSSGNADTHRYRICASTSDRTAIQDFNTTNKIVDNGTGKCLSIRIASGYNPNGAVFSTMVSLANVPYAPYAMTNKELTEKVSGKFTKLLTSASGTDTYGNKLSALYTAYNELSDEEKKHTIITFGNTVFQLHAAGNSGQFACILQEGADDITIDTVILSSAKYKSFSCANKAISDYTNSNSTATATLWIV